MTRLHTMSSAYLWTRAGSTRLRCPNGASQRSQNRTVVGVTSKCSPLPPTLHEEYEHLTGWVGCRATRRCSFRNYRIRAIVRGRQP